MARKALEDWNERRDYINSLSDEFLRTDGNGIFTYGEAYKYIAQFHLFCHVSVIYRALRPFNEVEGTPPIKSIPTNQLRLF
ncbi:hypothetical protein PL373_17505 [Tenacibaculum maritimum]|nr:hypothetical protein [Tenacibaculum maritimum]MDB0602895.1 hypothetical protein [Tenacibaculum maritimum]MDB0611361.1 hypothetical protein [Tenacibaculum maritimum]